MRQNSTADGASTPASNGGAVRWRDVDGSGGTGVMTMRTGREPDWRNEADYDFTSADLVMAFQKGK